MGKRRSLPPIDKCLFNTALEYNLNYKEIDLLSSVPLRGTPHWEAREQLRERCGARCLSWGQLPEEDNV